jgi:hypothetical protein
VVGRTRPPCWENKVEKKVERLPQVDFDLELIVAKQRMGPIRDVRVFCDVATSSVRSPRPAGA